MDFAVLPDANALIVCCHRSKRYTLGRMRENAGPWLSETREGWQARQGQAWQGYIRAIPHQSPEYGELSEVDAL